MEITSENVTTKYEPLEGCYGIVTGSCRAGAFLQLDNGEEAFAFKFGNLFPDTKVLCTVKRLANEEKRTLVSIDAVIEYAGFTA